MRENISYELRQAVFERDNYTCQYCGRSYDEADLEIEHIIPISKGGNNDIRNLATACGACNRAKGTRILTIGELKEIAEKVNSSLEFLISLASEAPDTQTRSEKLTLYLTPELIADIRDYCCLKRVSAVSYITALIEADLHSKDKLENLKLFRQLSDKA